MLFGTVRFGSISFEVDWLCLDSLGGATPFGGLPTPFCLMAMFAAAPFTVGGVESGSRASVACLRRVWGVPGVEEGRGWTL